MGGHNGRAQRAGTTGGHNERMRHRPPVVPDPDADLLWSRLFGAVVGGLVGTVAGLGLALLWLFTAGQFIAAIVSGCAMIGIVFGAAVGAAMADALLGLITFATGLFMSASGVAPGDDPRSPPWLRWLLAAGVLLGLLAPLLLLLAD